MKFYTLFLLSYTILRRIDKRKKREREKKERDRGDKVIVGLLIAIFQKNQDLSICYNFILKLLTFFYTFLRLILDVMLHNACNIGRCDHEESEDNHLI